MSTTLKLSIDEYERMVALGSFACLDRRIEFVHGELREMNPAGPLHDDYIEFLLSWASPLVAGKRCKVRAQSGLVVGNSVPEPDFVVLRNQRYGSRRPTANDVLLLVEVAESSLSFDLGEKAELYAQGGIAEYWVIDVAKQIIHRHLKPTAAGFQETDSHDAKATLHPSFSGAIALDVSELFVRQGGYGDPTAR